VIEVEITSELRTTGTESLLLPFVSSFLFEENSEEKNDFLFF
jgi:hypothetical protein